MSKTTQNERIDSMTTVIPNRRLAIAAALSAMLAVALRAAEDGESQQKSFDSPDAAFKALLDGLDKNSDDMLLDVLGHANKDLVVQSDKEETTEVRRKIFNAAKEHLKITTDGDKAVAHLGLKDWPYPIPMVKQGNKWIFDTAAGKEEILNRRIGRNELAAIKFVEAYGDAQRKYASTDHTGDKVLKYAQKLISSNGKRDGLYWPVPIGGGGAEEPSPLASMVDAGETEFLASNGSDVPYDGYYYKILTKQGSNPPNGKYDYVINGNMIAGFAIVAWPADYGSSGIMTFVMSHQGEIYQKDLGPDTAKEARDMDRYNPDESWTEVKPEEK
jgi:hypothetical protein